MVRKVEVRKKEEILDFIYDVIKEEKISINKIEKSCKIGMGAISRWKKASPSLETILKIFNFLNIRVVLHTGKQEDIFKSDSNINVSDTNMSNINESDIDSKILALTYEIIKCAKIENKELLLNILKAFL